MSEAGVGAVAAGVAKAQAEMVLISGHDGGTGASPVTSIQHAGLPWELGLAETHQVLMENKLRDKIRVQVDGQIKTGRDVAIAALLGAEEYGFATSALVSIGCCLLRKCHLNRCTMGIATQDPEMRKRFTGRPEYVENFMYFVAEEMREIMARLGFCRVHDMIGRADLLTVKKTPDHPKAQKLNFSRIFYVPENLSDGDRKSQPGFKRRLDKSLDDKLIDAAQKAIISGKKETIEFQIKNTDRTVGTKLSSFLIKHYKEKPVPGNLLHCKFNGSAGQSFGAFLANGVTLELEGDANDYLGKGLSGGRIIVYPPARSRFRSNDNIIAGNTILYGAIKGEVYLSGVVGERFGVRNSGAVAVIEGAGDHCLEYMTGGTVVVLGKTGRNFAAGMSGGIAYVLDESQLFDTVCNLDMVNLYPVYAEKDIEILQELINRHIKYTGSEYAKFLLDSWDDIQGYFVKVVPLEYAAALDKQRAQEDPASEHTSSTEEVYATLS